MALVWLKLYETVGGARYCAGAVKAIEIVKAAQDLDNPNSGLRGGIGGSRPIWGSYISKALPNWAAKFFIDAALEKSRLESRTAEGVDQSTVPSASACAQAQAGHALADSLRL
jgi:hypothetical protein